MPDSVKEKNKDWVTADIGYTTWVLNFACMVSRLGPKSYEKQVFRLISEADFIEEDDLKIDYDTNNGNITCYYSPTLDSIELISHPNIKWFHPGYLPIVLAWVDNE